jgi:hypothetical protein
MSHNLNKEYSRGFIGLLMLLIGVAVISFIIVKMDLFTRTNSDNVTEGGGLDVINQTKNAKNLIENSSRKAAQQ